MKSENKRKTLHQHEREKSNWIIPSLLTIAFIIGLFNDAQTSASLESKRMQKSPIVSASKNNRIIDADTIEQQTTLTHRLLCVDAVEQKQTHGQEATDYVTLLYKTNHVIYLSKVKPDNFGRSLSTVTFIDENNKTKDLARLLLLKGYAVYDDDPACAEKKKSYRQAQQYAMDNKLGIFSFDEVCLPVNYRKRDNSCDW